MPNDDNSMTLIIEFLFPSAVVHEICNNIRKLFQHQQCLQIIKHSLNIIDSISFPFMKRISHIYRRRNAFYFWPLWFLFERSFSFFRSSVNRRFFWNTNNPILFLLVYSIPLITFKSASLTNFFVRWIRRFFRAR